MYVDELVIEITRRCNLACRHCLRGDPQNKDMSNETINKLLEGITSIGTITFTGGEPSLAIDRIQYVYEQIKTRGINVGGFYVVTNGKIASKELMNVLIDFYVLCSDPEEHGASLVISKDQYHEYEDEERKKTEQLYKALSFYRLKDRTNIEMLINEGRAKGKGAREAYLGGLIVEMDGSNNLKQVQSTIYVNALGDVIKSCDMSYESQEENKIGNVHDKSLSEIIALAVAKI